MTVAPALLAVLPTILTGASVATQVVGSIIGTSSAKQAADDQAIVAAKNAAIAKENAAKSLVSAQDQQQEQDLQTASDLADQESVQAASGLKLGSRSFVLTRKAARELGRRDALNVREAGQLRAYAYQNESEAFLNDVNSAKSAGNTALLTGFLNAGSSIIGGATSLIKTPSTLSTNKIAVPATRTL